MFKSLRRSTVKRLRKDDLVLKDRTSVRVHEVIGVRVLNSRMSIYHILIIVILLSFVYINV